MTPEIANEIASEHISHWRKIGLSAEDAWRALENEWAWGVEWFEVRGFIIRWLLRNGDIA